MAAMQRFSVPHASPEIILSERKYSRGFLRAACRHCTRLWGTVEPASFARGAASWQVGEQMLCRFVLAALFAFACCAFYEWGSDRIYQPGVFFCQETHAGTSYAACRHCTRLRGRRSLSVSHTMPTVALPVGKCSAVLCLPRSLLLPAVH